MVARSNMYGCYGSYSYRLWSLANVWSNYQFSLPKAEGGAVDYIRCSQCHKSFPGFAALKQHVESAHEGGPGSSTPPPGPPAALDPAPTSGGAFVCQHCSLAFSQREHLEKHELLHSPNAQVSCKVCHKTFANVYRLQRHMISHDESAVLRKFKCPECDKAFKFKHHLKEHIRIHSGEKPFECANCGKRFSHSGSYSSHMTSKKCLVMNLKVGRGRGALDKSPQSARGSPGGSTSGGSKRLQCPSSASSPPCPPGMSTAAASFPSLLSGSGLGQCATPPASTTSPLEAYLQQTILMHYQNGGMCTPPFPAGLPLERFLQHYRQPAALPSNEMKMEQEPSRIDRIFQHLRLPALPPPPQQTQQQQSNEGGFLTKQEHQQTKNESSLKILEIKEEPKEDELKVKEQQVETESPRNSPVQRSSSSDSSGGRSHSDPVKSLLQTVGTSITKERLEVNMQKLLPPTPSPPPPAAPQTDKLLELPCKNCGRRFSSHIELHQHETYLCDSSSLEDREEGLAAKLEASMALKNESGCSDDCDSARDQLTDDEAGSGNSSGRKVRVRSLIADEQLSILKAHYTNNPKPKKEELGRIAEQIGFPVRVVQVWFQNTRARDRREGRFLVHAPYYPDYRINGNFNTTTTSTINSTYNNIPSTISTITNINNNNNNINNNKCLIPNNPPSDINLPLDLSTKKSSSSQCSSPRPSTHSDSEEGAMNLSHRSSRSPTPCHFRPYALHDSADFPQPRAMVPFMFRRDHSPAPAASPSSEIVFPLGVGGRLKSILSQPSSAVSSMFGSELLAVMNGHGSPGKRPWKQPLLDYGETTDDADDSASAGDDPSRGSKKRRTPRTPTPLGLSLGAPLGAQMKIGGPPEEAEGQFGCDQCDKSFSKQSSLARHKYEHSGQRPHKCDVCGKAFKHKHHLTEHKRLHSGEKPFQCSKCLKRFSHSGSYSQHMNHRYSYCKPYRE